MRRRYSEADFPAWARTICAQQGIDLTGDITAAMVASFCAAVARYEEWRLQQEWEVKEPFSVAPAPCAL